MAKKVTSDFERGLRAGTRGTGKTAKGLLGAIMRETKRQMKKNGPSKK